MILFTILCNSILWNTNMEFNRQFTITLTNGTTTLIVDNTSTMGISSASMSLDEQIETLKKLKELDGLMVRI